MASSTRVAEARPVWRGDTLGSKTGWGGLVHDRLAPLRPQQDWGGETTSNGCGARPMPTRPGGEGKVVAREPVSLIHAPLAALAGVSIGKTLALVA